jgi:hypothetical protein
MGGAPPLLWDLRVLHMCHWFRVYIFFGNQSILKIVTADSYLWNSPRFVYLTQIQIYFTCFVLVFEATSNICVLTLSQFTTRMKSFSTTSTSVNHPPDPQSNSIPSWSSLEAHSPQLLQGTFASVFPKGVRTWDINHNISAIRRRLQRRTMNFQAWLNL